MSKPKIDISESQVHALPLKSGAHVDRSLPGFMVLCGRQSRTYAFQREVNGRTIRVNLGRVGTVTANNARLEALKAKKALDAGENPNLARRVDAAKAMGLDEAYELYKKSKKHSPKTLDLYNTMFRLYLKPWAEKKRLTLEAIGLDRPGVRKLHEDITARVKASLIEKRQQRIDKQNRKRKRKDVVRPEIPELLPSAGESTANNCLLLLKGIYNRARTESPTLPADPTTNVNWHEDRQRQNSLAPADLQPWYERVQRLMNPVKQTYWVAVMLTGARRTSVAEARWTDVDLDAATWHFGNPKGGPKMRYTVPISTYLVDRLRELKEHNRKLFPKSEFVFPSDRSECGHLTIPRNDKQGLPMAHCLRHTYRTMSLLAGISDVHSHLLMNHRLDGVNAGYISRHITMDELAKSQEAITRYMLIRFGVIQEEAKPEAVKSAPKKGATLFELELKRSMTARRKVR